MNLFNVPINSPLLTCITPLLKDIAPQVYKAKVTLVHRPYLSAGLGGFHPVEFAFSGGPLPELERCIDFDIDNQMA